MPAGAYVADHNGRIRYANRHLNRLLGSASAHVEGSEIAAVFEPTAVLTAAAASAHSHESRDSEVRSVRDGRRYRRHCEVLSEPDQPSLVLVMLIEIGE